MDIPSCSITRRAIVLSEVVGALGETVTASLLTAIEVGTLRRMTPGVVSLVLKARGPLLHILAPPLRVDLLAIVNKIGRFLFNVACIPCMKVASTLSRSTVAPLEELKLVAVERGGNRMLLSRILVALVVPSLLYRLTTHRRVLLVQGPS